MLRNYWWVTRPKRKLILIPDILKIFALVAEGHVWKGNRILQSDFEESLRKYEWKAENISKDASGARTYAVMLYMLGLWFEDKNGVQITNAGKELISDEPPVQILTKQLLDFQYPSPYSIKINLNRELHIHPYRFILRLMIEKKLDELTQEEISFCLVPYAKSNNDQNKCFELIKQFRVTPQEIIQSAIVHSGTTEDNLRNIGNTIVNQLEYTGYFEERTDIKSLRFKSDTKKEVLADLTKYRDSFIQNPEDEITFQMRYGSGIKTTKDYRYTQSPQPKIHPNDKAIMLTYLEIALNEPIQSISEDLIHRISQYRGVSKERTKRVLHAFAQKPMFDRFEEKYLKLSVGGKATATDFEVKTKGIFSNDGFGFASVWVGNKPRHPDLFVYFDKKNLQHGLIDTKAYEEYTLPLDHKNLMAHTHIPSFRKIVFENATYDLQFFCYVSGGFGSGMARSFLELTRMTDIKGSYVTAYNLLQLLRAHRTNQFSAIKFKEIFLCNGEIMYDKVGCTI